MCKNCEKYITGDSFCRCDKEHREILKFIHEGNFDEIMYACSNCNQFIDM